MDYSKTVLLPETAFPMKANLPAREPEFLDFWEKNKIYEKMLARRKGKTKFVLHDGPPYANGHIHMGHALNKILKDMIVKFRAISGFYSPYVPGWDCHGLPIEHQLMKEMKKDKHSVDRLEFRKKAADFALRFVEIQKKEFQRLGIFGDWENPYLTLAPGYETIILKCFRELLSKRYIYRSLKPVLWCPTCETALAEAEVEYEEKESPSIYVKFPVTMTAGEVGDEGKIRAPAATFMLIWTTTPWTLPANVGLMFHPELEYAIVNIKEKKEKWIIAKALLESLVENRLKMKANEYAVEEIFPGKYFSAWNCSRIFPAVGEMPWSSCFTDLNVSSDEGTGIVHVAPGHGDIDYIAGHLNHDLPILSPVDERGKFSEDVKDPKLKGSFVLGEGNKKVLELLNENGQLVHQEKIRHSYPHCWRCKNPVIFRATKQWFLNVDHADLRKRLLAEIEKVQWIPAYGKNRIRGMVEQRPDWCLSRQRFWGTPIPIFYCKQCAEPLLDDQAVGMVEEIVGLDGSDVWFKENPDYFLKNLSPFKCGKCGGTEFVKENDILDVWFDSGVSHEAVLQGAAPTVTGETREEALSSPADLYLEGSDQHRGWFQSSLIPSVALHGSAPYRGVLTHGFIVDGAGKKMSKSTGNVIGPEDILKEYGADILRLWVAASDYREDIRLSPDILKGTAENYRRIRNTFRYLIGNISDLDSEKDALAYERLLEIDRWALARLAETVQTCKLAYESYEFHRVVVTAVEFCAIECSSFYFDVLKDRLYTFRKDSPERRSAQTALHAILVSLTKLLAPVLSFTCEEVWRTGLSQGLWNEESVFLCDFPETPAEWKDENLKEKWNRILKIREKTNLALEAARKSGAIGSSLAAKAIFTGGTYAEREVLQSTGKDLAAILIVSQTETNNGAEPLQIAVEKAAGKKCLRCWRYDETVNQNSAYPEICSRCVSTIR